MAGNFSSRLQRSWYDDSRWPYLFLPLSWLLQILSAIRRFYFLQVVKPAANPVPVVIVGNITVGGTGKTPLLIALANYLSRAGFKVGIISRGYGSAAPQYPYFVNQDSPVIESGDEALLIAQSTQCPVVINPGRRQALEALLQQHSCDVVLSDDGLQHYALGRKYEIAVIDGSRGLGNGLLLPAGPLRETAKRLQTVNCVVVNGDSKQQRQIPTDFFTMQLKSSVWRRVIDDSEGELEEIANFERIHAVTGIGNPRRFYRTLQEMNIDFVEHTYPDHHAFVLADIIFNDELPVVMTAKDAVKCRAILTQTQLSDSDKRRYWYVPVSAQLPNDFFQQIIQHLSLAPAANVTTERTQA